MDLEQRIGRIHRYGQAHTAQVYIPVSADTIEGQIFLLLEEKLLEIAKVLGKVDEFGQVTEDLRGQILGQLSERLSYGKLYQDAVRDPRLTRTRQELDVAIDNARTARQVVWQLFQDLEGFRLDEYKQIDDRGEGIARLLRYLQVTVDHAGGRFLQRSEEHLEVDLDGTPTVRITTSREAAKKEEHLSLLGLEHPLVRRFLEHDRNVRALGRALTITSTSDSMPRGVLTVWHVHSQNAENRSAQRVITIGLDEEGNRCKAIEDLIDHITRLLPSPKSTLTAERRRELIHVILPEVLRRDLEHKGLLSDSVTLN